MVDRGFEPRSGRWVEFAASPISIHTSWLRTRILCQSRATFLPADCCTLKSMITQILHSKKSFNGLIARLNDDGLRQKLYLLHGKPCNLRYKEWTPHHVMLMKAAWEHFTMYCSIAPRHVLLVNLCPLLLVNSSPWVGCKHISLCCLWKHYPVLLVHTSIYAAGEPLPPAASEHLILCWLCNFTLYCRYTPHSMLLLVSTLRRIAGKHLTLCCWYTPHAVLPVNTSLYAACEHLTHCCRWTLHLVLLDYTTHCVASEHFTLCCWCTPHTVLPVNTAPCAIGENFTWYCWCTILCCWWTLYFVLLVYTSQKLHLVLLVKTSPGVAGVHFVLCCWWTFYLVLVVNSPSCDAGRFICMVMIEVWIDDQLSHITILTWSIFLKYGTYLLYAHLSHVCIGNHMLYSITR